MDANQRHLLQDLCTNLEWEGKPPVRWTKGLSTTEIDRTCEALGIQSFCGTGYREAVHDIGLKFTKREPHPSSCVINTAPEGQVAGEHWVCLWYHPDPDLSEQVEYFDCAGLMNLMPSVTCLMEELSPFRPVLQNLHPIQNSLDTASVACGFHCIYFLLCKEGLVPNIPTKDSYGLSLSADNVGVLAYPENGLHPHLNDVHAMTIIEGRLKAKGLIL